MRVGCDGSGRTVGMPTLIGEPSILSCWPASGSTWWMRLAGMRRVSRLAGVSAFGFGGTNASIVMQKFEA